MNLDYIKLGNCLELMQEIPDKSIDLIITDPPYSMERSTGGCTNSNIKNKWSGNIKAGNTIINFDTDIKFKEWLPEAYRVLKSGAHCYVFTNDKNLQELLNEATKAGFKESNILVWLKNNATPNRYYMKNLEFVLFLYKEKAKPINYMGSKCAVEVKNINGKNKLHPTQKPVELLEVYIKNSTNQNDIILDPFMGSGSTCVAAINTGRHYIGYEKEQKYFDIADRRIKAARTGANDKSTTRIFKKHPVI